MSETISSFFRDLRWICFVVVVGFAIEGVMSKLLCDGVYRKLYDWKHKIPVYGFHNIELQCNEFWRLSDVG